MSDSNESIKAIKPIERVSFPLGQIVATRAVSESLAHDAIMGFVLRHASCDWGEVNAQDARENEFSLKNGFRIFSSYRTSAGETVWVITEADRSSTTVMFPEDY